MPRRPPPSLPDPSHSSNSRFRSADLLITKLATPPAPSILVARPHLIERLHAGIQKKLTLITAPAGWGKSTLLAEWRASNPAWPLAWVSLDVGDNDPVRFWTYVMAAFDTH